MHPVRRLAAYAIDWCVFACWAGAVFAVAWLAQGGDLTWPRNPWLGQALGITLTTVPFALYFGLLEGSAWRATVGKRLLGLRVVTRGGARASRGRTLGRAAVKLLPWEIGHTAPYQFSAAEVAGAQTPAWVFVVAALAIGGAAWYVASLWSADGRTPYDRLCGTRVERATTSARARRAPAAGRSTPGGSASAQG